MSCWSLRCRDSRCRTRCCLRATSKRDCKGLLNVQLSFLTHVVRRRWWTNNSSVIRMQQFTLLLPLGWRWTAGRLLKCTRASYNNWLIWLLCNRWRRCLDWINARVSTMFDVQRVPTTRWRWRWWWLFDKCCINLFVLAVEWIRGLCKPHRNGSSVLTGSSDNTEKMKLWPSGSLLGLSWLGHICNKGNEQAGLLPQLGIGGSVSDDFDSRLDELSPPESELMADDWCCFGVRQIFFRRDDVESRRFSGFCETSN